MHPVTVSGQGRSLHCDGLRPSWVPYPQHQGLNLAPTGAARPREGQRLWENNTQRPPGNTVALPHHLRCYTITFSTKNPQANLLRKSKLPTLHLFPKQQPMKLGTAFSRAFSTLSLSTNLSPEATPSWATPLVKGLQQLHQITQSHSTGVTMRGTQARLIDEGSDWNSNVVKTQMYESCGGRCWQGVTGLQVSWRFAVPQQQLACSPLPSSAICKPCSHSSASSS